MIGYGSSYKEVLRALGQRARDLRLARNLRQDEVAERAGVGLATVQRFERLGTASLESALRIATALRAEAAFDALFQPPTYRSIDEALQGSESPMRQRVRKQK